MAVRRSVDRAELAAALAVDRFYAAYAIGVLEDRSFARSDWTLAEGPDSGAPDPAGAPPLRAVGAVYRGYQPSFGFLMGPSPLVREILADGLRPYQAYFSCRPSHLDEVRAFYETGAEELMIRMRITVETFRPVHEDGPRQPVRLASYQVGTLNRLYARGVGSILTKALMDEGIYYGVFAGAELAAVAGTHFIAPTYGIAAVGNVFTHPSHRGRGLAKTCTSAVTAALLKHCPDVVLNVHADNEPARWVYRRLGFQDHCPFVEVLGTRRETSSLRSLISRVFGAN
ncbi:MAG TPA: GNAT family N-acetyltransferase [Dehalococcoidia bacterium]|nr:GNAT family N-acetyltransferase [Dehalococcoidia bacterium]